MAKHRIYKYPLPLMDEHSVIMPSDARILSAQEQDGALCLWALVDPAAEPVARRFRIFGTGQPMDAASWVYIGTVQTEGGRAVWHVFAEPTLPEVLTRFVGGL